MLLVHNFIVLRVAGHALALLLPFFCSSLDVLCWLAYPAEGMIARNLDMMRGGKQRYQKTAAYGHFGRDDPGGHGCARAGKAGCCLAPTCVANCSPG